MNPTNRGEETVFEAALRLPQEQRSAYLDEACGQDAALRERLEVLLSAHDQAAAFMNEPVAPRANSTSLLRVPLAERVGDKIGRYKLLQQIGEGGCGVVYMAEQEEPVRRRVALKVIKLGMDTKTIVARFEAERQALALMDHPNIAKVFDAGATETGRPFFVMELVRGIKITNFCDQNQLPTRERLHLFVQVCEAIQHAHQKGVIHRDIKPSNILVTLRDGVPVPKVIDFGIAKATTDQLLTDKTVFTEFQQFLGTPAYMSPEQAEMSELGIDTRSDIYSLGILLYELLTGKTPFDTKDLLRAGLEEMRRTIREQEPLRPSTRLSTMLEGERIATAKHRQTDGPKLIHLLRGDLDWIVMKCLEKDRARRYPTANGLASDIQRHLNDGPVLARPPSRLYEFQKTVRRHKFGFAATAAVIAVLCFGLVASISQLARARRAEKAQGQLRLEAVADKKKAQTEAAKSRQVAQFLRDMLEGVGPGVALGRDTQLLREILDKTAERVGRDLNDEPEAQAELRSIIGNTYLEVGDYTKAEAMHREALRLREMLFGKTNVFVAASLNDLANTANERNDEAAAETLARQALAMRRQLLGNEHPDVASSLSSLADALLGGGKLPEAETLQREALAIQRKAFHGTRPEVVTSLTTLGQVLWRQDKLPEAEAIEREALAMSRELWGNENLEAATLLGRLGSVFEKKDDLASACSFHREALAMRRKLVPTDHPYLAIALNNLVRVLCAQGEIVQAEPLARECLSIREKSVPDDWHTFHSRSVLGGILLAQKKYLEAEPLLLSGYEGMKQREGVIPDANRRFLRHTIENVVELYKITGRPDQASQWNKKLEEFGDAQRDKQPGARSLQSRRPGRLSLLVT